MGLPRLLFLLAAVLLLDTTSAGSCPPKFKVHNDKPACFSDADCQKYGKICCPNQYNTKSCTDRAPFGILTGEIAELSGSHRGVRAVTDPPGFCKGVKCLPGQVCRLNPLTRKYECLSA